MKPALNISELKTPFIIMLIGLPLSGKTTWIKENILNMKGYENIDIISRDDIIMELSSSDDYNKSYSEVDEKEVNTLLRERLIESNKNRRCAIVDMANMSKKRKNTLNYFKKDYTRVAILFPLLDDEKYTIRNDKRKREEKKHISLTVLKDMLEKYAIINEEDKFDIIVTVEK
jgi:predicted kinase